MPRDSFGQYSLPSGTLVSTGDTVLVSQHNPFAQDVAQSLTNSVDRNGSGGMLADLPMNNNKITGLAPGEADTDAATVGQLTTGSGIPVGCIMDYGGATPPDGWLLCYGQAVSRSTYAGLFAVLSTTFGSGDGSTTFNLPDLRGRVSAGKDNMGGSSAGRLNTLSSSTLGASGGAQTHTLTTAEMPSHTHTGSTDSATTAVAGDAMPVNDSGGGAITQIDQAGHTHTITMNNTGGGGAHNNVQPTLILNKIIKATT